MLEAIVKPVVFGSKADQHPGRITVPSDHNLLGCGKAQVL